MRRSSKFELRNPVTPYVCSTPLDFIKERDFLSDKVFPKINHLCRLRGSYFRPADLRWQPSSTKTRDGLLLKTLLDATRMCSPFFLGLLGETYGPHRDEHEARLVQSRIERRLSNPGDSSWLDTNLVLAGSGGHPWVLQEEYQYRSVTELEVMQGALFGDSPYVTFYFRRSDHLDNKCLARAEKGEGHESDWKVYCSESQQAKVRVHDLRQRLVNKGVPVKYFSTEEELGELVLADWKEIVDMCLPPLLHDVKLLGSVGYREWLAQQSFVKSCSEVFVSTPDVEETLKSVTEFAIKCTKSELRGEGQDIFESEEWSSEDYSPWAAAKLKQDLARNNHTKSILLLSGGRGVGKSALAVHWLNEFKADNSHICVISHFVSASNRSMDLVYFLQQTIRRLREEFLLSENYDSNEFGEDIENIDGNENDNFLSLCEAFVAALSLGPCVILLDGLNELNSNRRFDWLPDCLPKTCKIIFTTTSSDISYLCLSKRPDTTVIRFPASMADVNTTVAMISQHFPTLSQLIGGEKALKRLAHLKIMQTALGSRVTGSELVCHRVYSHLDNFMEQSAEVWSLRDFWTLCVQNWGREFSWRLPGQPPEHNFIDDEFDYSGWVTDSLCLIATSRNGLTQEQVISVLRIMGYEGDLEVSNYDWLQFRLATGSTLRELADGRLVFGHKYLQEIAEYLFFRSITSCSRDPEAITRCANLSRLRSYHKYLARYFFQQRLNVQVMEELPWHLLFSWETTSLVAYLANCQALLAMMSADWDLWQQDLTLYWSVCRRSGHLPEVVYLQLMHSLAVVDINDVQAHEDKCSLAGMVSSVDGVAASTPRPPELSDSEEDVFQAIDSFRPAPELAEETEESGEIKTSEDCETKDILEGVFVTQALAGSEGQSHAPRGKQLKESSSQVASLGWYLARFLLQINQGEASNILLSSLVSYINQNCLLTTELHLLLCRGYHLEGRLHEACGRFDGAEKSFKLALHAVMAAINMDDKMRQQEITQYLKGLLLGCHGNLYINKNQLSEAEELLVEAFDCVRDNSDLVVLKSRIYFHLGIVRSRQCDYQQAEWCLRESAKLRSLWFGRGHPLVAEVLTALANLLVTPGNTNGGSVSQARSFYKQALRIQEKFLGACHLSVGDILFQLGKLLAEEDGRLSKEEAQECFRRCLDIRATTLGGNNPLTIATQQRLSKLNVALQLKNYETTSSRQTQVSFNRKELSIQNLHESELSKMLKREKSKASPRSEGKVSHYSVGQDEAKNRTRLDSVMGTVVSLTSACDRLLSDPVTDMPRLLWRKPDNQESLARNFVSRSSDLKDVLASSVGEHGEPNRTMDVDESCSDDDEPQVRDNETRSIRSDLSDHSHNGASHAASADLHQTEPINADNQQKQKMNTNILSKQASMVEIQKTQPIKSEKKQLFIVDMPQKQPIIVEMPQKQPIIVEMPQKQPIIVEMPQKQPIISQIQQKQPALAEIQKIKLATINNHHNQPITTEFKQKQPIIAEFKQKQPIIAEFKQKQPIIAEFKQKQPSIAEFKQKQPIIAETEPKLATIINIHHKDDNVNDDKGDDWEALDLDSYANVIQNKTGEKKKKKVTLHPLRVAQKVFQSCQGDQATYRPQTGTLKSRISDHSERNVWSGTSKTSHLSSTSSHLSHCSVPGRHGITLGNTQTISGPYNCLTSLMDDQTCARQTSVKLHHMSAWYHVPGRFPTPRQPFPAKRMQRTKSARDIEALLAINALKPQLFGQYQLTEEERSQMKNRTRKSDLTKNTTYAFHTSSKPMSRSGSFFQHSKMIDRQNLSKGLMVGSLDISNIQFPGSV